MSDPIYRSPLPFSSAPSPVLAVYCSDSRYDEHCEDFIIHGLNIPIFDQFIVPGGPAWLIWDWRSFSQQRIAREEIGFLVQAHDIKRVVLIAHEDCALYKRRHPYLTTEARRHKQFEDLRIARQELLGVSTSLQVETYFASLSDDGVVEFVSTE